MVRAVQADLRRQSKRFPKGVRVHFALRWLDSGQRYCSITVKFSYGGRRKRAVSFLLGGQ